MVIYKTLEDVISKLYSVVNRICSPLVKRRRLELKAVIIFSVVSLLIFILSGGIALVTNPDLKVIITPRISGGESPLEFTIFFILNYILFLSFYMIIKGVKKGKVDNALVAGGLALLFIVVVINWWLLLMKL